MKWIINRQTPDSPPAQQGGPEPISRLTGLRVYPLLSFFLSFSIQPQFPQNSTVIPLKANCSHYYTEQLFRARREKVSCIDPVWIPIRFVTFHFRDRRGAASLGYRNRAEVTRTEEALLFGLVFLSAQKLYYSEHSLKKTATVNFYSDLQQHWTITSAN